MSLSSMEAPTQHNVLVTDYDGTITRRDFYHLVRELLLPADMEDLWEAYRAGKMTHFEALAKYFAAIRAPEQRLEELITEAEIDPLFANAVQRLKMGGWDVIIVSAGCDWYINRQLTRLSLEIPVYSNGGRYSETDGLQLIAHTESEYYDADIGVSKPAVVKKAQERYQQVAFAGDGPPDYAAIQLVQPELRFACGWLADQLDAKQLAYHPFNRWSDIASKLLGTPSPSSAIPRT